MNANSVYMADRYCYTGDVITVAWDTNGVTGITLHNGGENGVPARCGGQANADHFIRR